jgi:hypothetical protein
MSGDIGSAGTAPVDGEWHRRYDAVSAKLLALPLPLYRERLH